MMIGVDRLLYLTTPGEDYLQDQLLYGLRTLLGARCVDWPRKDVMYQTCSTPRRELYGRGFSLWKHLPEIEIDREAIARELAEGRAGPGDALVFGSVRRQRRELVAWLPRWRRAKTSRTAFVDGEDGGRIERRALGRGRYFKRERTWKRAWVTHPISFSIPGFKVREKLPEEKRRLFATHVQCEEAFAHRWIREHCRRDYAFDDEESYREDLAVSHFAVTMKKAGWDCMRHYEIAANGCVPCFFGLAAKSRFGAPFGLVDGQNCLVFESAAELERKTLELLDAGRYVEVADGALAWCRARTCERVAADFLERAWAG